MRLPDFVILGAMKAGTTSLFRWLEQHPDVALPEDKEPAFFSRDERWQRGLGEYATLFAQLPAGRLTGEASVHYSDPAVAERAARRLQTIVPEAKLIFLARDPVERLRSHYRHQVQRGREKRPMLAALSEPDSPYVRCSHYQRALEPWVARFGRERLLIVEFERLVSESEQTWQGVLQFLGLSPIGRPKEAHNVTANKRGFSGPMRHVYDLRLARYVPRVPRPLRTVLKPLAFRGGDAYDALLSSSRDPVPPDVSQALVDDYARVRAAWGPLT
jgi:hypothetical protein